MAALLAPASGLVRRTDALESVLLARRLLSEIANESVAAGPGAWSHQANALLDAALEDAPSEVGTEAFRVLACGDAELLGELISGSLLQLRGREMLRRAEVPPLALARLCAFTHAALGLPSSVPDLCDFLLQLLLFIDHLPVYDLFESVVSDGGRFGAVQDWLVSVGFGDIVAQEMETLGSSTSAILKLVRVAVRSERMRGHFATPRLIAVLARPGERFEDERWEALTCAYCAVTREAVRAHLPRAAALLGGPEVSRRVVAALTLLARAFNDDAVVRPLFADWGVADAVVRLFERARGNSVVLTTIGIFARVAFKEMPELAPPLVAAALREARAEGASTLRAVSLGILTTAARDGWDSPKLRSALRAIDGYREFCRGELMAYERIRTCEYGGPVPSATDVASNTKRRLPPRAPVSISVRGRGVLVGHV